MSYTDVEWASRYSHLWFIPAIVRTRSDPLYMPTRLTKERAAQIERKLFDSVVEDLGASDDPSQSAEVRTRRSPIPATAFARHTGR